MNNLPINKLRNNKNIKSSKDKYIDWMVKIRTLQNQIFEIEKVKNIPVLAISVFLLKTQLVEFKLKQLITSLDLYLNEINPLAILKKKTRTPKEFNDRKFTLGHLSEELRQFKAPFLRNLQNDISSLVKLRNKFIHNLFDPGSIDSLKKEAGEGIELTNRVFEELDAVDKEIKK